MGKRRGMFAARTAALAVLALLCAAAGCRAPGPHPAPADTRDARWRQDLGYLAENLAELHPKPFRSLCRAEFDLRVHELADELDTLQDHEILVHMARLVARIEDGHTRVLFENHPAFRRYPLLFERFSDGVYILAAHPAYERWLGARLVTIGDTPLEQAEREVAAVLAHDAPEYARHNLPGLLRMHEVLHALELVEDRNLGDITVETPDGARHRIAPIALKSSLGVPWVTLREQRRISAPLARRNREQHYWYQYLPESRTLYCAFNRCADAPDLPFGAFSEEMFELARREPVDRILIDLRNNAGGNSRVLWPLVRTLRYHDLSRRGRVFALIDGGTASSAVINAIQLQRWARAVLVGEPAGQRPNHFGEVQAFTLPNSGVTVTYSTRWFETLLDDPPELLPDVRVHTTFADYLAGRDPVFDYTTQSPAGDELEPAAAGYGRK